jgi:cob(I)alamin adenosyltransferase
MVILNKIYTKTGDDGTTGLGNGERRKKYDLRVAAYGSVDEANAAIGMARLYTKENHQDLDDMLQAIQNDMFDLGADLATPEGDKPPEYEALRIISTQVKRLENDIDRLNGELKPLRTFVLPGGSPAAANLHLARTIARRAERQIVELGENKSEKINKQALVYINRVSDFLFVAARYVNEFGTKDVLWVPGKNR